MPTEEPRLTPQQRLAVSRHALMRQLQGDEGAQHNSGARPSLLGAIPWAPVARGLARHWWHRHPVHAAGRLARPVLEKYAKEDPFKLVAAAAIVGAAVVLTRPWRLLNASALVASTIKTSELAGVVNALMQRKSSARRNSP